MVSISRAIGPALSASLFSFSAEKNILGGYGVYVAFATLSISAIYLATRLPPKPWDEHEPKKFDTEDFWAAIQIQDTQSYIPPFSMTEAKSFI